MRWLDRLERRFGNWSIPQFPIFVAAANGTIYLLGLFNPLFVGKLLLDTDAVRAGEVWRLVTFLFVPPQMNPLWMALALYTLYSFSQALENEWGEFKLCFFYLVGALATIVVACFF